MPTSSRGILATNSRHGLRRDDGLIFNDRRLGYTAYLITTLNCSMDALPFDEGEFDVIWSEGAVYNMGFEAGVSAWGRFLKPGGKLIVSEITWLRATRPAELQSHWETEYPEIDVASAKIGLLERHGHSEWNRRLVAV